MSDLKQFLIDGLGGIGRAFRSTKEAYGDATRFARLRILVLLFFGVDAVATVGIVTFGGGGGVFDVEVWFERGFPSDMLIVRNLEDHSIDGVTLVLDDRYRLKVERLRPGIKGFEVNRDFRDGENVAPNEAYRPRRLEIRAQGQSMKLAVGNQPAGGS